MQPLFLKWWLFLCDEKIITILVDYDFYNNTKIIIAYNKKAKRHNYQGGGKSSYIEIFK